jgi:hypothetical protein
LWLGAPLLVVACWFVFEFSVLLFDVLHVICPGATHFYAIKNTVALRVVHCIFILVLLCQDPRGSMSRFFRILFLLSVLYLVAAIEQNRQFLRGNQRKLSGTDNQESPEDKALRSIQDYKKKYGLKVEPQRSQPSSQAVDPMLLPGDQESVNEGVSDERKERRKKRKGDGTGKKRDKKKKLQRSTELDEGDEFEEFTGSYKRAGKKFKKQMKVDLVENETAQE